ncbi:MAG: branched-chain amino acid ABC transporter permease [Bacillota bacterium]
MKAGYRKERIDRGIKARADDIFAISSYREILYLMGPRLLAVVGLLLFPLFKDITGAYWQTVGFIACIIALLTLSWNFLFSVGLVSLGQAFFFGIGAYFTGYFNHTCGLAPLFSIPLATVCGAVLCTILIFPVLRLRGIYFALITFALPLFLMRIIEATGYLGGTEGISGLQRLPSLTFSVYITVVLVLAVTFIFLRLFDTDYGLVLRAIHDNDMSVLAGGLSVQWYKAQAVFLAALPATFAGALMTHHYRVVGMPAFAVEYSLLPLTAAVVGGTGTFAGGVLGALILVPVSEMLRAFGTLRIVMYGMMLILFVVGLPEGIYRFGQRKYFQFERIVPLEEKEK